MPGIAYQLLKVLTRVALSLPLLHQGPAGIAQVFCMRANVTCMRGFPHKVRSNVLERVTYLGIPEVFRFQSLLPLDGIMWHLLERVSDSLCIGRSKVQF